MALFAEIILPIAVPQVFTYSIPEAMQPFVSAGKRVVVLLGKKKIHAGIVLATLEQVSVPYAIKPIVEVLDDEPIVHTIQLRFWEWMSKYYMAHIGEVMSAAIPSGFKLNNTAYASLSENYVIDPESLSETELSIVRVLEKKLQLPIDQLFLAVSEDHPLKGLKSLLKKGIVLVKEEISERYVQKKEARLKLSPTLVSKEGLSKALDTLEKSPKQQDALLFFLSQIPVYQQPELNHQGITKKSLVDKYSDSVVRSLLQKGIFEEFYWSKSRIKPFDKKQHEPSPLSTAQEEAFNAIIQKFSSHATVLLHGVTGSGKTEVYQHLILKVLENGGQVLFLVPEIGLTTQLVERLGAVFGEQLAVYHSKYSDHERVEVWKNVLEQKSNVIVGVRSSVFLPFTNLSLVIVDEEHDPSYKQSEPAPRYHARDAALFLAHLHHAKVVLGSATPSVESFHLAQKGQYGLVQLQQRFGNSVLPTMEMLDLKVAEQNKTLKGSFAELAIQAIKGEVSEGKQAIVFQNRRGYAPYIQCQTCEYVPVCPSCDISLTYHMAGKLLKCHYCGHKEKLPPSCPSCGVNSLKMVGFGTEKLEEELALYLPDIKIGRMDQDTTRNKNAFKEIISAFEKGETQVLVGTQMVTKGFDFENVTLVCILDVDRMLYYPDFRSQERMFQQLVQVSGRSGRREVQGKVIIQTRQPLHPVYQKAKSADYERFYVDEIKERENFVYPPFSRLIKIYLKHKDRKKVEKAATEVVERLVPRLGSHRVLGPAFPLVEKIRDHFVQEIIIKLERDKIDLSKSKSIVMEELLYIGSLKENIGLWVYADVDPY